MGATNPTNNTVTLRFLQMWLPQTLQTEAREVTGVGASWVPLPSTFDAALFRPYSNHRSPSDPIPFSVPFGNSLLRTQLIGLPLWHSFIFSKNGDQLGSVKPSISLESGTSDSTVVQFLYSDAFGYKSGFILVKIWSFQNFRLRFDSKLSSLPQG